LHHIVTYAFSLWLSLYVSTVSDTEAAAMDGASFFKTLLQSKATTAPM